MMGLVVISLAGILLIGSGAVSEIRGSVEIQNAEHTMREVDARLSQVAFSANDAHTLDFSGQNGDVEVTKNGRMTITVVNGTNQPCREEMAFGAIEYRGEGDEVVAYQAGGVWKRTDDGSVMLSPPDMQYRNGTFSFQMVNVTGSVDGSVTQLQVSKNTTASRADSQAFRETFTKPRCNPPDNATLTVHIDYYRAWGKFFKTRRRRRRNHRRREQNRSAHRDSQRFDGTERREQSQCRTERVRRC
ncbi:DUF7289 family protein [Haladaptatus sp. DFWS20]|uniref:DUF7289 family protein n=1 Tax=Haladaptatus sp. DFWS20 TaxID=3403467 RepID=UPI003EBBB042